MNDFSFRWNPQLWAAQGWVIGIANFHGSSGFGQKFADSITGDYGTKPTIDVTSINLAKYYHVSSSDQGAAEHRS